MEEYNHWGTRNDHFKDFSESWEKTADTMLSGKTDFEIVFTYKNICV